MASIARSSPPKRTTSTAPRHASSMCRRARRRSSCSTDSRMRLWQRRIDVADGRENAVDVALVAQPLPREFGDWITADLHVHMNYGGHYRNTPEHLAWQAQAEDLDVVENLIVNKEERIPDIAWFGKPGHRHAAAHRACAGIPHQFLGPPRPAEPARSLHRAGLLRLSPHRARKPVAAQRRHRRSRACAAGLGRLRASVRHRARSGQRRIAHPRTARRCRARQGRLHGSRRVLRSQGDRLGLVSPDEPRLSHSRGRGLRHDGELRVAARAGGHESRVPRYATASCDDGDVFKALKAGHGFVSNGPLLGLLVDGHKPGETVASKRAYVSRRVALARCRSITSNSSPTAKSSSAST